jgi:O-antigen/teichoic acid export membrane protein
LISKAKQLSKDSLAYGIGSVISRSMNLIALPIFTRLFSPGEYAFIDMVSVVNVLLCSVMNLGFDLGQGVYFFEEKKKGVQAQKELISTIFRIRIIWGIGVVIFCTLCFPVFNSLFFDDRLPWQYFALAFTGSLFLQISIQFSDLFQLLFRPLTSSLITISQACGSMAITILIVLLFDVGVFGVIVGTLIGSICSATFGWWMARDYLDLSSYNAEWWSRLSRFGLPTLPLALAGWLTMNLDRIMIMNLLGPEAMGVYAVGIKIALILALVIGAIKLAWFPISLDAIQEEEGKKLIRNASCVYLGIGFSVAIIISFLAPFVMQIIAPPGYFGGHMIVGMLCLFFTFEGYLGISQLGLLKNKKTYLLTIFSVLGVSASATIIYLLIPSFGALGAAVGMLVGIIIRNVLSQIVSEIYYHVNFMSRAIFLQFFLALFTIFNMLTYGSDIYSFLLSLLSISLILVQTHQNSEFFRHIFVRDKKII